MKIKTETKKIQEDLEGCVLPEGLGYKRGYFREFEKELVTLDCIEEDITSALNERIIVRPCYDGEKEKMQIPLFFEVIVGVHTQPYKYARLLNFCSTTSNSIYIKNIKDLFQIEEKQINISLLDGINIKDKLNGKPLNKEKINENLIKILNLHTEGYVPFDKQTKQFNTDIILNPSDSFIKEHGIIDNLSKFPKDIRKYLIDELNKYILSEDITIDIDSDICISLYKSISKLPKSIVDSINNYTISNTPPKIIMFKEKKEILGKDEVLFLGYLHNIGFDIIIFIPSADDEFMNVLSEDMYSTLRLPKIDSNISGGYINELGKLLKKDVLANENVMKGLENFNYETPIESYVKLLKKSKTLFEKVEKKMFL